MKCILTAILVLVTLMLSGCAFNKASANPSVVNLDPSFIKVGETSFNEVLDRFGPPAPASMGTENVRLISDRHLRYISFEAKTVRFNIGYGLILPFKWSDAQVVDELLIEFDKHGRVSGVYQTVRDVIWPPMENETDRDSMEFNDMTGSL